jgi:hypothetical protein
MAINFLNTVDLNSIQIENIVPENLTVGTRGAGVLGQMYFDTGEDTMMQFVADSDGLGNPGYVEIGSTSAVESIIAGAGIGVSAAIGNVTVRNTGLISVLDGTFIDLTKQGGGDNTQLTADLSAVDGTSTAADRFLTKANKWATIPFGDITEVQGGTYINVTNQTGPIPIVNHDLTTRTDTASAVSPASGATFTTIDSVTTNTTGHVTALNVKTVTLPPEANEKYTLPVTAIAGNNAEISLTGSTDGVVSTVNFIGTAGRIALTSNDQNNGSVTINFPDDVIIVDDLTVNGKIIQVQTGETNTFSSPLDMGGSTAAVTPNKILNVATGTAGTDGVNLGQVELLVAGVGVFQGGYNATNDPGVPIISTNNNVALDLGDYFVVTADGDITFTDAVISVEVGDFIFANAAIPAGGGAGAGTASTQYTFVISDANVAGAGATDAGTQKGVAGFDSANFNVSASGWVQIKPLSRLNGRKQALNNTAPVVRTFLNGLTTYVINLADTSLFGTGALAEDVTVEVTQNVSPYQTVYADVTRSGSASMSIIFSDDIAINLYRVMLTHIGS